MKCARCGRSHRRLSPDWNPYTGGSVVEINYPDCAAFVGVRKVDIKQTYPPIVEKMLPLEVA